MGERTPHLDPERSRRAVGLAASHTRGHIVRAVLEGVAFSLRDTFTIFDELACRFSACGSAAAAHARRCGGRFRPTSTDMPVETVHAEEGAAYGAALLAGVGAGVWPTVDEACDRLVRSSVAASPNPARVAVDERTLRRVSARLSGAARIERSADLSPTAG